MADKSKTQISEELRISWSSAFLFLFFVFFLFNLWQTIHERWFIEYSQTAIAGEKLIDNYNIGIVLIGLAVLVAIAVVLFLLRAKQSWRFITSMQLGVLLMSSVAVGTILGTLVFQNQPADNYIAFYSEPMYTLFRAMHLTDVFDSWWFLAFEVLLAVSLITVTIRTKPFTLGRMGPLFIHIGIVVIIFGAFFGTIGHIDAVAFFAEGQQVDFAVKLDYAKRAFEDPELVSKLRQRNLIGQDAEGMFMGQSAFKTDHHEIVPERFRIPLEGSVRLDRFEEEYYEEPFTVIQLREGVRKDIRTGQETGVIRYEQLLDFRDTRPLVLDDKLGTIRILRDFENYSRRPILEDVAEGEEGTSLAQISMDNAMQNQRSILKNLSSELRFTVTEELMQKPYYSTFNQLATQPPMGHTAAPNYVFKLYYSWKEPTAEQAEQLGLYEVKKPFKVIFSPSQEGDEPKMIEMRKGDRTAVPDTNFQVELLEFYHHFSINRLEDGTWEPTNVSEYMMNPAVKVRITGGNLEEPTELYIISGMQAAQDRAMDEFKAATGYSLDLVVQNLFDAVMVGETGEMVIYRDGAIYNRAGIRSESYRPDYTTHQFTMLDARENGREVVKENFNDLQYGNYAVELELDRGGSKETKIIELMTGMQASLQGGMPLMEIRTFINEKVVSNFTQLTPEGERNYEDPIVDRFFMKIDDKNELTLQVRGDYIKEWKSHVTVLRDGEELRKHTIRVNEPLIYNDFFFYQSSYDPVVKYGEQPQKWYTYLRVTKDPGLTAVYLGIAMMVFGMVWAFYIGPRFRKSPDDQNSSNKS